MNIDPILRSLNRYAYWNDSIGFQLTPCTSPRIIATGELRGDHRLDHIKSEDRVMQPAICLWMNVTSVLEYLPLPLVLRICVVALRALPAIAVYAKYGEQGNEDEVNERNSFCATQLLRSTFTLFGFGYLFAVPDMLKTMGSMIASPKWNNPNVLKLLDPKEIWNRINTPDLPQVH
ncbi:MAG: hypothetical protein WB791_10800 [Waddliaceae bacterium]